MHQDTCHCSSSLSGWRIQSNTQFSWRLEECLPSWYDYLEEVQLCYRRLTAEMGNLCEHVPQMLPDVITADWLCFPRSGWSHLMPFTWCLHGGFPDLSLLHNYWICTKWEWHAVSFACCHYPMKNPALGMCICTAVLKKYEIWPNVPRHMPLLYLNATSDSDDSFFFFFSFPSISFSLDS